MVVWTRVLGRTGHSALAWKTGSSVGAGRQAAGGPPAWLWWNGCPGKIPPHPAACPGPYHPVSRPSPAPYWAVWMSSAPWPWYSCSCHWRGTAWEGIRDFSWGTISWVMSLASTSSTMSRRLGFKAWSLLKFWVCKECLHLGRSLGSHRERSDAHAQSSSKSLPDWSPILSFCSLYRRHWTSPSWRSWLCRHRPWPTWSGHRTSWGQRLGTETGRLWKGPALWPRELWLSQMRSQKKQWTSKRRMLRSTSAAPFLYGQGPGRVNAGHPRHMNLFRNPCQRCWACRMDTAGPRPAQARGRTPLRGEAVYNGKEEVKSVVCSAQCTSLGNLARPGAGGRWSCLLSWPTKNRMHFKSKSVSPSAVNGTRGSRSSPPGVAASECTAVATPQPSALAPSCSVYPCWPSRTCCQRESQLLWGRPAAETRNREPSQTASARSLAGRGGEWSALRKRISRPRRCPLLSWQFASTISGSLFLQRNRISPKRRR